MSGLFILCYIAFYVIGVLFNILFFIKYYNDEFEKIIGEYATIAFCISSLCSWFGLIAIAAFKLKLEINNGLDFRIVYNKFKMFFRILKK